MDYKIYKFSYKSKANQVFSKVIMALLHLLAAAIADVALLGIFYRISLLLQQTSVTVGKVALITGILICAAIVISFVITPLLPQYASIGDSIVIVKSGCLLVGITMLFRSTYTISINNIETVEIISKDRCWRRALPVISCNWDDMVVIKTQRRNYYIPVENSNEFIRELKSKLIVIE
ncbi:MAG: hypothetical protein IJ077_07870 [Eubacterium sp.]|nr:hypothetical protein [Eubacterium sp.]